MPLPTRKMEPMSASTADDGMKVTKLWELSLALVKAKLRWKGRKGSWTQAEMELYNYFRDSGAVE